MSTKIRGKIEGKSNTIFISSSTSFGNFPKDEMTRFLEDMGSKDIKDIPFGLIASFEGKIIPNDNKDKVIINGLSSCHLNVLKENGQTIADYLERLDKINRFMKPYALRFSNKVRIVTDDYSGLFPEYVVQPALNSFKQSSFEELSLNLTTKKIKKLTAFGKNVTEYSANIGLAPEWSYREDKGEFDLEKQKFKNKTYNLSIMLKKPEKGD